MVAHPFRPRSSPAEFGFPPGMLRGMKNPTALRSAGVLLAVCLLLALPASLARADTLEVGPGRKYERIERAVARARPGDVIRVHALPKGAAYERVALLLDTPRLHIRGVPASEGGRVPLSGRGFDYSGRGSTPRAIIQFNPGADGCVVENLELFEAHNTSHNGAGIRIHQANHVVVRNCEIRNNDMGVMSNGDGTLEAGVDQLLESCIIHHNGRYEDPGYNHNLYLGGTSVTLRFCEIYESLTGHNVKSRAHYTRVEFSYIHDSANRELDLVDAQDTARPGSHAVLLGNVIVKASRCAGNRTVIHFGQDGGKPHDGTIHLIHNTIVQPYRSPVIDLSAPQAKAFLTGNIVTDNGTGPGSQRLAGARNGADRKAVTGRRNLLSPGFDMGSDTGLVARENFLGPVGPLPFADPAGHDYRIVKRSRILAQPGLAEQDYEVPPVPGAQPVKGDLLVWQYEHPARGRTRKARKTPDLGAHPLGRP